VSLPRGLALVAERYPGRALRVEGHTDAAGAPAYNQRLSTQRAAAVKRWLVDQAHVAARRISTHGFGPRPEVVTRSRRRSVAADTAV
jgi:OOP family OmpA-OmpF porin